MNAVIRAYNRLPIEIIKGDGFYLYDIDGNKYLDFASGIAVVSLGHNNSHVKNALVEQSNLLWHCSNFFTIPAQQKLASRLAKLTFADSVFFCSTGLEAVETAIKLIRKYQEETGKFYKKKIITFENAFHGRSITCLSAGGNESAKKGFGPFLTDFIKLPINDLQAFENAITDDIGGVLIEPVQSEGGVYPVDKNFLQSVRKITIEHDIVLCFDEIQTGYGRTGTLFKYQQLGIEPDLMTIAKAMGNGFPVAACLAKSYISDYITPGTHGSTFGGNPLAMAVGNAVLDEILKPGIFDKVKENSQYIKERLLDLKENFPHIITDIRMDGLIIGVEILQSAKEMTNKLCYKGLIVTKAGNDNVIRLLPPLTINKTIIDEAINKMIMVFENEYKK